MNCLYELTGPSCAMLLPGSWKREPCPHCKRSKRIQIKNLSLELTCPSRNIWSCGEIIVTYMVVERLKALTPPGMFVQPVEADWYIENPWGDNQPPPMLFQIRTHASIHAQARSIIPGKVACCVEGVRDPLYVKEPTSMSDYGFWNVEESGGMILFTKGIRDLFLSYDHDLEFMQVPYEK